MTRSYVQINGVLYEKGVDEIPESLERLQIIPEIEPYKSMITGEMITSRAKHREHLKKHGCQELGNEPLKWAKEGPKGIPDVNPQKRKELIRSQIANMTQKQFDQMRKNDLDRIRWNSNT